MFYGLRFIYDGTPSEKYSLLISSGGSADSTAPFAGNSKLYTEKLYQRADEFLYGTSIEPMLEFQVVFTTDNYELTAQDISLIGKWLFGQQNYKKLRVIQPDMDNLYYDCVFINASIMRSSGGVITGVQATAHCRHPWATTEEKSYTWNLSVPSGYPITHVNQSDFEGYTFPTLVITVDVFGGDVSIINTSDNNREFKFTAVSANEVLTVNNSLQIITSSTGLNRLSKFNKKFFRLVKDVNALSVTGAISTLVMRYPLARRIGG